MAEKPDSAGTGVTVQTSTTISYSRIADMFVGAIEGGSTHWCDGVYWQSRQFKGEIPKGPFYAEASTFMRDDFKLEVFEDDGTPHIVTRETIAKGLQVMATDYPNHLYDLVNENDDADTADIFLQCVVLGEQVYG